MVIFMDINKNIKRMRNEKNLTQEELAQKINVTRQAVSNWENAKTQPDLETLTAIASALEIDLEMLLYGKKYVKADGECESTKKLSGIKIILSVVGTVFIALGLVFMFFHFWEDLSEVFKVILSAVPLLSAQGFAIYVLKRKYGHISWRECAGTAVVIGAVSTVALINSVLDIHCGTENCLVIDVLMCVPAIFLFNAVVPLAACLGMAVFMTVYGYFVPAAAVILICLAYTLHNRKKVNDARFSAASFLCISAVELFAVCPFCFGEDLAVQEASMTIFPIALLFPFALDLIPFKTDSVFRTPVRIFNLFGGLFVLCFMDLIGSLVFGYSNSYIHFATPFAVLLCAYTALFLIRYRNWRQTSILTVVSGLSVVFWMINYLIYYSPSYSEAVQYSGITFFCFSASVYAVCKVAEGVKNASFLNVNAGLAAALINLLIWYSSFAPDVFIIGLSLLIFGAVIIAINAVMAYRIKKSKNKDASEVAENDEK